MLPSSDILCVNKNATFYKRMLHFYFYILLKHLSLIHIYMNIISISLAKLINPFCCHRTNYITRLFVYLPGYIRTVSYTHLDVYKRQSQRNAYNIHMGRKYITKDAFIKEVMGNDWLHPTEEFGRCV